MSGMTRFVEMNTLKTQHGGHVPVPEGTKVFRNNLYMVLVTTAASGLGPLIHLSIKRNGRDPIHDWRDLQQIKNEILGPEFEAVELYPAESRAVDLANQYHLWALPNGNRFPFGYQAAMKGDSVQAKYFGAQQRDKGE